MPVQKVNDDVPFDLEYYDLERSRFAGVEEKQVMLDFIRPFDLSRGPMFRVAILKRKDSGSILMVDMHHIISDGISHTILVQDFQTLNEGEELPPLRIQYKDYAEWQNREEQQAAIRKQEEFWLEEFNKEIPVIELPTDFSRPSVQSFEGNRITFEIDSCITQGLNGLIMAEGVTLYMVLLALYNIFLAKISRQEDIVVGTPVAGRRHADLERTIGMFVNMLAIRNYPTSQKSFRDFLAEVKEKSLGAFENQEFQFENLVEKVQLHRDLSRNPIFDTTFTFQNMMAQPNLPGGGERPGIQLKLFGSEMNLVKYDLDLLGAESGDKLYFILFYSTDLFRKETIEKFIEYFRRILSAVVEDPGIKIKDIEIVSKEERERIRLQVQEVQESVHAEFDI
jgi:hypothetical protein